MYTHDKNYISKGRSNILRSVRVWIIDLASWEDGAVFLSEQFAMDNGQSHRSGGGKNTLHFG